MSSVRRPQKRSYLAVQVYPCSHWGLSGLIILWGTARLGPQILYSSAKPVFFTQRALFQRAHDRPIQVTGEQAAYQHKRPAGFLTVAARYNVLHSLSRNAGIRSGRSRRCRERATRQTTKIVPEVVLGEGASRIDILGSAAPAS